MQKLLTLDLDMKQTLRSSFEITSLNSSLLLPISCSYSLSTLGIKGSTTTQGHTHNKCQDWKVTQLYIQKKRAAAYKATMALSLFPKI